MTAAVRYLFGPPMTGLDLAVTTIRRARRLLADYLAPGAGITPAVCIERLRPLLSAGLGRLETSPSGNRPEAIDIVLAARSILVGPGSDWQRLNALIDLLDSTDAQRFASEELPFLVDFGV